MDLMNSPHALVVPAGGQSHADSCMLLARSLASVGFDVSFVHLSSEYAKLKAKEPVLLVPAADTAEGGGSSGGSVRGCTRPPSSIRTHVVHDGLGPDDAHDFFSFTNATKDNLFHLIQQLQAQGTPPTCLVSDAFAPWTASVAQRACLPLVHYMTCSALGYILMPGIPVLFAKGIFPEKGPCTKWKRDTPLMLDHIPGLPPFSSELYPRHVRFADAPPSWLTSSNDETSASLKQGERMLVHTVSELEPDALHALRTAGVNAYAVGPLLHYATEHQRCPVPVSPQEKGKRDDRAPDCISWLDTQAESSVIYVAFGTFVSFPPEEVQELALGLEASGIPFLWVLRGGAHRDVELPMGFQDRVRGKGMIISWAPQALVLGHRSVGGFLTHCGWSSVMESLWEGVPMLCCPGGADQMVCSHYICEAWGVGLELGRTATGGLERSNVEQGVRGLMREEAGRKARLKAKEVKQLCREACQEGGQSLSNLQKFYQDMKSLACAHE